MSFTLNLMNQTSEEAKANLKNRRIDVNMKYETYCNAISDGGVEEWDFAWKR